MKSPLIDFLTQQGAAEKFEQSFAKFCLSPLSYREYLAQYGNCRYALEEAFDWNKSQAHFKLPFEYWLTLNHKWWGCLTDFKEKQL